MRRGLTVLALILALAPAARATLLAQCCACLPSPTAHEGSIAGVEPTTALFCAEAETGDLEQLELRCVSQAPPGSLTCYANLPGPSCREQLLDSGIICPTAGAPAAAPFGLAALALVLGGLGIAVLARRVARA